MTREEAIRRIKAWNLDSDDMEVLSVVVPELAESEDERIRKALIELVTNDKVAGFTEFYEKRGITCDDVIAYLEKQKEQKSAEIDEDIELGLDRALQIIKEAKGVLKGYQSDDGIYECDHAIRTLTHILKNGIEQKTEEKPINWTELTWEDINELEDIINKVHYEFRNGIGQIHFGKEVLEKFREYKGDEYLDGIEEKWSGEDNDYIDAITVIINRETALYPKGGATESFNNDLITWLKALPERFNLQPKQEWSEEDEHCIELLDTIIDSSALIPKNKIKCHAFLKSLHS